MSELEQNIPDDFWRKAFEEASEAPPPRVWDAVERRLDESDGSKILPLWGTGLASSRPFVIWGSGIAAAVALLLVGWWAVRTTPTRTVAQQQVSAPTGRVDVAPSASVAGKRSANPSQEVSTDRLSASKYDRQHQEDLALNRKPSALRQDRQGLDLNQLKVQHQEVSAQPAYDQAVASPATAPERSLARSQSNQPAERSMMPTALANSPAVEQMAFSDKAATKSVAADAFTTVAQPASILPSATGQALSYDRARTSALRLREPAAIQRIVWFRPYEPLQDPTSVQSKREPREVWTSLSMMSGAYNPSVAVRSGQASATKNNYLLSNASASQPSVDSRASLSIAYQAGVGIQLSEHWSVESGVGYLAGRSTVDSPVQATVASLQAGNSGAERASNLYVDALRYTTINALPAMNSAVANFDNMAVSSRYTAQNSYIPQVRQSLTNDYMFVQVPVQVGYQLRPRKRLSLALLGGLLSNIFVRNTVGDDLVVTSKDGVYRPIAWSATMGARFRYRPSRQWSASLAGIYQPSLGLGTRPGSTVESHPTSTGLSFGVDYHF